MIEDEGGNEEGGFRRRVEMRRGEVTSMILDGECFGIFFIRVLRVIGYYDVILIDNFYTYFRSFE